MKKVVIPSTMTVHEDAIMRAAKAIMENPGFVPQDSDFANGDGFVTALAICITKMRAALVMFSDHLKWRDLKKDPPPPDMNSFFVGHRKGGRIDYVFRWPHPKTGKLAFWCEGEDKNYVLTGYTPNVWFAGPPAIPGSDVEKIQQGKFEELGLTAVGVTVTKKDEKP